jgi:aminopeptidase N
MPSYTFSRKHLPVGLLLMALMSACGSPSPEVLPGVSLELARQRAATISNINYQLWFGIPAAQDEAINGRVNIDFDLSDSDTALQLDFRESTDKIRSIAVNGTTSAFEFRNEHIVIPPAELNEGENTIAIEFVAGDTSLNRNPEYLYTLFVPDRARTAFPLFDQPNLKATFELTLDVPPGWNAISNAPLDRVGVSGPDGEHPVGLVFRKSDLIPSYLFSFVAGEFEVADATAEMKRQGRSYAFKMLHRETDVNKVERNINEIFRLHVAAVEWLEEYTGIAYPFEKLDFALIPSFQYGGMEHVGAIQYRAASLMLDEDPSDTELLGRASLIAHEVAHMWFGNLVTMEWFNDVWTKEVFANFMAAKIVNPDFPDIDHDLNFLMRHHPRAYAVDRSEGANPIRQELHNLNEAGQMYGAIIYNKAPIMMRQLEFVVGEEKFREGMREYLSSFAYANATWPALIDILDAKTDTDLKSWSDVWVNTPGRPEFEEQMETTSADDGLHLLVQHDVAGRNRVWSQQLGVLAGGRSFTVESNTAATLLTPDLDSSGRLMFGTAGTGYGLFPAALANFDDWGSLSEVQKGSQLINVNENVLARNILDVEGYFLALLDVLEHEENQLLINLALQQLSRTWNSLLTDNLQQTYKSELESVLWRAMQRQSDASRAKTYFMAFAELASSDYEVQKVYGVWARDRIVERLTLSENDDIDLARVLAIRLPDHADSIIQQQLDRTVNPDNRRKLKFIAPSLSPSDEVRDEFFASLQLEQNRQTESWVLDALENLHHPSRIAQSERYLLPSLALLQEIQVTGDIFFPTRWLVTSLRNYQSDSAVATVRNFLAERPDYNAQLRMKILQAADMLFRSNAIIAASDTNN